MNTTMKPIKKIKEEEKRLGKESPTFDGYVEPDFPNERENNKTLEGVDANGDGVRDDVEIWINRNAEDQYIRIALKDLHRRYLEMFSAIQVNESEDIVHEKNEVILEVYGCISTLFEPYDKYYLTNFEKNGQMVASDYFEIFFTDTFLRKNIYSKYNFYNFTKSFGGRGAYTVKSKLMRLNIKSV